MTALQTSVELRLDGYRPGMQTDGGNPRTTRSCALVAPQGESYTTGFTNQFGLFYQRSESGFNEAHPTSNNTQMNNLAGVVLDDKLQQNDPASNGGSVVIYEHDSLLLMLRGTCVVQTVGTLGVFESEIYLLTGGPNAGKLATSLGGDTGFWVGGASFTYGVAGSFAVPPVTVIGSTDGLAEIMLCLN